MFSLVKDSDDLSGSLQELDISDLLLKEEWFHFYCALQHSDDMPSKLLFLSLFKRFNPGVLFKKKALDVKLHQKFPLMSQSTNSDCF